jgi:predicted DNA-binding transcriptional regulator AlpA
MTGISTETVMVKQADLQELISRLARVEAVVEEIETDTTLRQRVDALSKNGMLSASAICKLVNWSTRTFYRRVEAGTIPITLENGTRYKMSVDNFVEWYKENFVE